MEHLFRNASSNGSGKSVNLSEYTIRTKHDTTGDSDTVELQIEHGVPIPPLRGRHGDKVAMKNPMAIILLELEVGQSIHIPAKLAETTRNAMAAIRKHRKKQGLKPEKFVTRTDPAELSTPGRGRAFRVWRA